MVTFTEPRPLAEGRDLAREHAAAMREPHGPARSARLHAIWRAQWGATTTPQLIDPPPAPSLAETLTRLDACLEALNARFNRVEHSTHRCRHGVNLEKAGCGQCLSPDADIRAATRARTEKDPRS